MSKGDYHPPGMFSPIPDILEDVRSGKLIVLVDDENRENEGDLVLAAQHATPEKINTMTRLAAGYLCLSLTNENCDRLALHPQSSTNSALRGTAMTVSIDGHPKHGVGTGISAPDRAKTIALAIDPTTGPDDFVRPGHINPLRARDGGVLVRTGQTEGGLDLARLAGLHPSALVIEIVREDGQMARRNDLEQFCKTHGFRMCTVEQLIEYRLQREGLVHRLPPENGTTVRTEEGAFTVIGYQSVVDPMPHVALTVGGVGALDASGIVKEQSEPTLVRVQRRNLLGDIFGDLESSPEGPTRDALRASMRTIQREGRGALVYIRPTDPPQNFSTADAPTSLSDRLSAPDHTVRIEGQGFDLTNTVPRHLRELGIGSQILWDLGLHKLRLLSNRPKTLPGLDAYGLEVVEHVPLESAQCLTENI